MVDEEMSDIIIPAHYITGCDHTSGQYGREKSQLMKTLISEPEMYGCLSGSTCAEARAQK